VSTNPAAIRLTRIGASSMAMLAMSAGEATVIVDVMARPAAGRRAPVPPMNTSEPPGRTRPVAARPTYSGSMRCSATYRRTSSRSMSAIRA
jgi:hypothetical protein